VGYVQQLLQQEQDDMEETFDYVIAPLTAALVVLIDSEIIVQELI
jgi:hypothetical protein